MNFKPLAIVLLIALLPALRAADPNLPGQTPGDANPILPGYFADPSMVTDGGKHFIFATLDPWGDKTLGCWESEDFKSWKYHVLNWPTKAACTSPSSKKSMVWAPSVVRAGNGKFYMYVSVGSEVWVGTADAPAGPWRDANGGRPLIPADFKPGFHMIDAEAFIDTDGQAYLYWGSGLDWVNGKCWVVKLKPDMVTFDGEVRDVTPANYFEAPFMFKQGGRYHLMYSSGKTTEDSYQVHVATGDNPLGPFQETAASPVLVTRMENNVRSPGHHAVFQKDGKTYILYHRHNIPFDGKFVGRQTCVDELTFGPDGNIQKVAPTHSGPPLVRRAQAGKQAAATATASGNRSPATGPERAVDDNFATLWAAAPGQQESWLQLEFKEPVVFTSHHLRFEYPWKEYRFRLETSDDGHQWKAIADHSVEPVSGSPVILSAAAKARYVRLVFPGGSGPTPALFEWQIE